VHRMMPFSRGVLWSALPCCQVLRIVRCEAGIAPRITNHPHRTRALEARALEANALELVRLRLVRWRLVRWRRCVVAVQCSVAARSHARFVCGGADCGVGRRCVTGGGELHHVWDLVPTCALHNVLPRIFARVVEGTHHGCLAISSRVSS
jgi:hypothetical protein